MKKLMMFISVRAIVMLFSITLNAQTNVPTTNVSQVKKNKITYDVANAYSTPINIAYERVVAPNISITAAFAIINTSTTTDLEIGQKKYTTENPINHVGDILIELFTYRKNKLMVSEHNQIGGKTSLGLRFYFDKKPKLNNAQNKFYIAPEFTLFSYKADVKTTNIQKGYFRETAYHTESIEKAKINNYTAKLNFGYQVVRLNGLTFDLSSGLGFVGGDSFVDGGIEDGWASKKQFGASIVDSNFVMDLEFKMGYAF